MRIETTQIFSDFLEQVARSKSTDEIRQCRENAERVFLKSLRSTFLLNAEEIRFLRLLESTAFRAIENFEIKKRRHVPSLGEASSFEELVYLIAHDMKTPLSKMVLCADLVKTRLAEGNVPRELSDIVETGLQAGRRIEFLLACCIERNKRAKPRFDSPKR